MFNFLKDKLKGWFKSSSENAKEEEKGAAKAKEIKQKKEKRQKDKEETAKKEQRKKEERKEIEKLQKKLNKEKSKKQERIVSEKVIEDIKKERGAEDIKTMPRPEEIEEEIKKVKGKKVEEEKAEETEKEAEPKKNGFFSRVFGRTYTISEQEFSEMFESLELILLENNVALEVVDYLKDSLKKQLVNKEVDKQNIETEIKTALKNSIESLFAPGFSIEEKIKEKQPFVIAFFGINGSGKCITGDSEVQLSNGDVVNIKKLYEEAKSLKEEIQDKEGYVIRNPGITLPSINFKNLKLENKQVHAIWKLKSTKFLYKISLSNGEEITVTPEHPFFTIQNGIINKIISNKLKENNYIAVNKHAPLGKINNLELLEKLADTFFVGVENTEELYISLKKMYGSLKTAHSKLNIKQSFNTFAYFWKKRKIIPIKIYLKFKKILKANSLQYSGSGAIPIPHFTADLSELAGLIMAEGHLSKNILEITNKDRDIINRFNYLAKKIFGINPKTFVDNRNLIRSRINNQSVIYYLNSVFSIPFGKKSTIIKIPSIVFKSNKKNVISFLRSYIEAEGHISAENRTIELSTASKDAAKGLSHLFRKLGIITTLSKRKYKNFKSYRIFINGYSKFNKISKWGLYTKKNKYKLNKAIKSNNQFEITELVPNTGSLIRKLREQNKKYQYNLSSPINCAQSLISQYESGVPIPRTNLLKLSKHLKNNYLSLLATSDISWLKVKSVKKIISKERWVYDLTINKNHNFIANGIIVHNTTSIAKIAYKLKQKNISVVLAAADTFRAASIEQLKQHGEKLKVHVISQNYGSDPASVAYDAIEYAKSHKIQAVLIDTAGRMHTKENLIKEMGKIVRVSKPDLKIFVGEAITGNDATEQAKTFNEAINIDGIILSKQDVDEKGGTSLSVSYITKKPILLLGTGQEYKDLEAFDKDKLIKAIGL